VDEKTYFTRVAQLRRKLVFHPACENALKKLEQAICLNQREAIAQNFMLLGRAGTGKSTIKKVLIDRNPPITEDCISKVPILAVDTPSAPTITSLASSMLFELGDPAYSRGTNKEKEERIEKFFRTAEVQLLIIDEIQHFVDRGRERSHTNVADWLKTLLDRTRIPTVLMGLERSEHLLRVNDQLRRRFSHRLELKPFGCKEQAELQVFAAVIIELFETLEVKTCVDFLDPETLQRIHFATDGIIDAMVRLFVGAMDVYWSQSLKKITQNTLEQAFEQSIWSLGKRSLNPFNKKFNWKPLNEPGMPFHEPVGLINV
jgi:type II secretory pathway predicted ATPase ExeA